MEKETQTTRVRGNFSQSAKGVAQLDITSEAPTVEEMKSLLGEATDAVISVLEERKIPVAHKNV